MWFLRKKKVGKDVLGRPLRNWCCRWSFLCSSSGGSHVRPPSTTSIHERREAPRSLSPLLSPGAEPTSFSRAEFPLSRPAAVRFQSTTGDGPPRIGSKHLDLVVVRPGLLWLRNPSDSGRGWHGGALASWP